MLAESFNRPYFVRALVGSVVFTAAVIALNVARHKSLDSLLPVGFVVAALLAKSWRWRGPTDSTHAALPTLTDETEALPVILTVFDERERITGSEQGWVVFADGWLVYEGVRSEFSLTKAVVGHPEYLPNEVVLRLVDGRRVGFRPMTSLEAAHLLSVRGDGFLLGTRFRAWSLASVAQGTSTLPPRTEHPERSVERLAFPPTYGALALFLAMIANAFFGPEIVPLLLILAAGCFAWFVVRLVRFWRSLPRTIR